MVCKNCGANIPNGELFCPNCGTRTENAKFCKYCGAVIGADCVVCPACGRQSHCSLPNSPSLFM